MAEHITRTEDDTAALAAQLAQHAQQGDIWALHGDLGAGKSVFARGFIQALAGPIPVPSPTFTLIQTYDTPAGPLHHFDLYRLESPEEVLELGWDEAMAEGICLIEWPQRAQNYLPAIHKIIHIAPQTDGSRKITLHDTRS